MTVPHTLLALTRTLIGEPEFTAAEVAARANVDVDLARRMWRAMGFPPVPDDERAFTHSDIAVLRIAYQLGEQGVTDPGLQLQITRVAGRAIARIAEAQVAAVAESRLLSRSETPDMDAVLDIVPELVPMLESFLTYTWRRHLLAAAWRQAAAENATEGGQHVAVGFADIVGFTAVSQHLTERELAAFVDRFESLVVDQVPGRSGRVIKMIGDAVMFTADDMTTAAEIAFGLVTPDSDRSLPLLRAGVAFGPVLSWQGDLFGTTVNLASRLVGAAHPGTILVSELAAAQLQNDGLTLKPIRGVKMKGIEREKVFVLRRA
jgi:adenylate cyclase